MKQNDMYQTGRLTAQQVHTRKKQRRRKRRIRQLRFFFVLFVLIATVVLSLTVFFKIDTIKITGQTRYPENVIITQSNIELGNNLFLYNTAPIEKTIEESFVYIEKAKIKKRLPGTLEIVITEAREICTIETNGVYFVVSDGGKIVERVSSLKDGLYNVTGIDMSEYKVGQTIMGDGAESIQVLSKVTESVKNTSFEKITAIDLTDIYNIKIVYDNRITVKCGTHVEFDYKLEYAKAAIQAEEKSNKNVKGTLDVSYTHTSDKAVFSPSREDFSSTSSETVSEN